MPWTQRCVSAHGGDDRGHSIHCIQIHSSSGWHRIVTVIGSRAAVLPRQAEVREEPEGLTDLSWTRSAPREADIRTRRKKTVARSTCERFR
jgi:hypothetical protein